MKTSFSYLLTLTALLLCLAAPAQARERILDFHSTIQISAEGALTVTERIRVVAEGRAIRHGIYRDFPLYYREPGGGRHPVSFEVLAVRRNGAPIAWRVERRGDYARVYMADKDKLIPPGIYTFTLRYRTSGQLIVSEGQVLLHWNVTGTG